MEDLRYLVTHYALVIRMIWRDWMNPEPREHWYQ